MAREDMRVESRKLQQAVNQIVPMKTGSGSLKDRMLFYSKIEQVLPNYPRAFSRRENGKPTQPSRRRIVSVVSRLRKGSLVTQHNRDAIWAGLELYALAKHSPAPTKSEPEVEAIIDNAVEEIIRQPIEKLDEIVKQATVDIRQLEIPVEPVGSVYLSGQNWPPESVETAAKSDTILSVLIEIRDALRLMDSRWT